MKKVKEVNEIIREFESTKDDGYMFYIKYINESDSKILICK